MKQINIILLCISKFNRTPFVRRQRIFAKDLHNSLALVQAQDMA